MTCKKPADRLPLRRSAGFSCAARRGESREKYLQKPLAISWGLWYSKNVNYGSIG